ncbi:MAG: HAMP domain-containing sensor histidine kinase [Hespellia sp.]|nr:HAMP domain-containing sensor histidine kinase [Hespellia sp.]
MKRSIKKQMIILFVGLITCIVIGMFIINARFLEQYYIFNKEDDLVSMYTAINDALVNDTTGNEEVQTQLGQIAEQGNISFIVSDGSQVVLMTDREDNGRLMSQLFGYKIGMNQDDGHILEKTNSYEIQKANDPLSKTDYIEMWGTFDNGDSFIMRSPLESIKDSAKIANKFLLYMGVIAMMVSGLLVWYFSKKLTDPLLELVTLSKKMANLDFDAKYTSGGDNEIGVLGENFNVMSNTLEKAISELKSANNELQHDIEQKEKLENMRTEFLGNVSHELKTPIALIQGYAEGLKEGVNEDPESREFYCDVIMDEAGKMNQMVKNLLTLNQLEFGDQELEFVRFDIVALVRGVVQSCEILVQQADANVSFAETQPIYVWADEFKTEQVVRNYLTNAIHHAANEKRIEIRIIKQADTTRVTVFNSGSPIPEDDLAKLWEKFYKVDKAHTREYGGNGIGLSIVKAIMESFHQQYGVKNYDNGVEFWFELDSKLKH